MCIDNIRDTRFSRNPRIARVLTEFGWVRELNEGVKRIYEDMEDFFLDFLLTYLRYRRLFRESLPVQREDISRWLADHPLRRTVSVRRSDRVSTPLTYGILRPVILLPDATCREDWNTLCCILAHEYTHIRLLDAAIKPVFIAAACVHWFNPLVWGMFTLVNRDIELRCDEAVLRLFGSRHRSFYATALLRMEAARSGLLPLFSSFSKNHMEERIIAIMKPKKTSRTALLLGAALVVSITTAFATSGETPEQRDMALNAGTVFKDQSMMSYTDPDGVTHYIPGGRRVQGEPGRLGVQAHADLPVHHLPGGDVVPRGAGLRVQLQGDGLQVQIPAGDPLSWMQLPLSAIT